MNDLYFAARWSVTRLKHPYMLPQIEQLAQNLGGLIWLSDKYFTDANGLYIATWAIRVESQAMLEKLKTELRLYLKLFDLQEMGKEEFARIAHINQSPPTDSFPEMGLEMRGQYNEAILNKISMWVNGTWMPNQPVPRERLDAFVNLIYQFGYTTYYLEPQHIEFRDTMIVEFFFKVIPVTSFKSFSEQARGLLDLNYTWLYKPVESFPGLSTLDETDFARTELLRNKTEFLQLLDKYGLVTN